MSNRDKTGPIGQGAMSGRGLGICANIVNNESNNNTIESKNRSFYCKEMKNKRRKFRRKLERSELSCQDQ